MTGAPAVHVDLEPSVAIWKTDWDIRANIDRTKTAQPDQQKNAIKVMCSLFVGRCTIKGII